MHCTEEQYTVTLTSAYSQTKKKEAVHTGVGSLLYYSRMGVSRFLAMLVSVTKLEFFVPLVQSILASFQVPSSAWP